MEYYGSNFLRFKLALSLISGKTLTIKNIRKQNEPNKKIPLESESRSEGIQEYEAKLLKLIDKICDDTIVKISEDGTELFFKPGFLIGNTNDETNITINNVNDFNNFYFHCGKERSISYYLEFLIMVVPFFKNPVKLKLKGITDDSADRLVYSTKIMCNHFFKTVLKLQEDSLNITILKRGIDKDHSGEVLFYMNNLKTIEPFDISETGLVERITGNIYTNNISPVFRNVFLNRIKSVLYKFTSNVHIEMQNITNTKDNSLRDNDTHFMSISLFGYTNKKCLFTKDLCITEQAFDKGKQLLTTIQKPNGINTKETNFTLKNCEPEEDISEEAISEEEEEEEEEEDVAQDNSKFNIETDSDSILNQNAKLETYDLKTGDIYERFGFFVTLQFMNELKSLASIGSSYQWLPLLFMSLAKDTSVSKIYLSKIEPYAITLIRMLADVFNITFDIQKAQKSKTHQGFIIKCVGIGYRNFSKKTF